MSWDNQRFEHVKHVCTSDIKSGHKRPSDYMGDYKRMVELDDFEACKAITEVLEMFGYKTADTHRHIRTLNIIRKRV